MGFRRKAIQKSASSVPICGYPEYYLGHPPFAKRQAPWHHLEILMLNDILQEDMRQS